MFRLESPYSGLDGFFHTGTAHHVRSNSNIESRIRRLDSIYQGFENQTWNFSEDQRRQNEVQNYCLTTIEALREASLCFIMGFFHASVLMSSVAAERIIQSVILLKDAGKLTPLGMNPPNNSNKPYRPPNLVIVGTVYGDEYYAKVRGERFERLIARNDGYYYTELPSLGVKLLKQVQALGVSCGSLISEGERIDDCIFVARRNAAAHARYEQAGILEQRRAKLSGKEASPTDSSEENAAFDQYDKASRLVREVFAWFDKNYRRT